MEITKELHGAMMQYLANEHQTMMLTVDCPACGTKIENTYSDSVANVTSESVDACHACGLSEEFAYGASRTLFEGVVVPEDVPTQQVILGLLRKMLLFKMELHPDEVKLMDGLLGVEQLTESELDSLMEAVAQMNLIQTTTN